MNKFIFLALLALPVLANTTPTVTAPAVTTPKVTVPELKFNKILFVGNDIELSGITIKDNFLHLVGDKLENHFIYRSIFSESGIQLQPYINLKDKDGFIKYIASTTLSKEGGHILKAPLDMEGLAYCGDTWYLANEQARQVLKVSGKIMEVLPLDFAPSFLSFGIPMDRIEVNAGFEGIAVDCKNEKLYLAQERQPRAIIVVDLKEMKVTDFYDISTENIEPSVKTDFADLHFEKDHLYILERNQYVITKFNPATKTVVARYRYKMMGKYDMKDLYVSDKPYGLAEGLGMSRDTIYLTIDNNKADISASAQKQFKAKSNHSSVLFFQRPSGF